MAAKLSYVIEFVGDMDRAVKFYRDVVGLPLKFRSRDGASSRPAKPRWGCIPLRERTLPEKLKSDSTFPICRSSMTR